MQEKDSYQDMQVTEGDTTSKTWRGTSLLDLCPGGSPWNFYVPPLSPSRYHEVLYELSINRQGPPVPHYTSEQLAWDENHVRMPFSPKNLYRVKENGIDVLKPRWDIIKQALSEPIKSSRDLERAIGKYNSQVPEFQGLHSFFDYVLEDEECNQFFSCVLPGIIDLALNLPELLPANIPLLKKKHNKSISFSQIQIASLLANAFLCTFPWRKDMAVSYPGVNFTRLFCSNPLSDRQNCVMEKLKCICHYFRRILSKHPIGVVTFERRHIPKSNMPRWDHMDKNLGNTRVHIDSEGTIEDNGLGCLQIDFANKNIGGGVLSYGCVQEEIRFVICPELIISRLFTEQLGDCEAVIIMGAERFSKYTGYGEDFKWDGDYIDETPFDDYGRRRTSIAVIDATHYWKPSDQFYPSAILREVNKAFVGFYSRETISLAPVATGNWGCGAFRGSPYLKALIQLMACSASNRDLVYFSFGNEEFRDSFYDMYLFFGNNRITVQQLWKFLSHFGSTKLPQERLYSYIQQSYFDSKKQKSLKDFFRNKEESDGASASAPKKKDSPIKRFYSNLESSQSNSDTKSLGTSDRSDLSPSESFRNETEEVLESSQSCSDISDIIPSSQPSQGETSSDTKRVGVKNKLPNNHDEILSLIDSMGGRIRKTREDELSASCSLLSELDKVKKQKPNVPTCIVNSEVRINMEDTEDLPSPVAMEVDDESLLTFSNSASQKRTTGKKITDYFTKINKLG